MTIVPGSIVSVAPDITAILPAKIYMESLDQITSVVILLEIVTSIPSVTVTVTVSVSVTVIVSASSSHAKKKSKLDKAKVIISCFIDYYGF